MILDDAFGCYDEKRLKYTLKWLSEQSRQVIIFSCQKRELEILNEIEMERQVDHRIKGKSFNENRIAKKSSFDY